MSRSEAVVKRVFDCAARLPRGSAAAGLVVLLALSTPVCRAHGDLHAKIVRATKLIAAEPENAGLYLGRAELYRLHREWGRAKQDLKRAATLDPTLGAIAIVHARMRRDLGDSRGALDVVDRFLREHPDHGPALEVKAKVLIDLGRPSDAIAALDRTIANTTHPGPDMFVLRARILRKVGGDRTPVALAGLEEGIRRLGPATTLSLEAIEVELALGRVDAALSRLDRIAARSPRKDVWFERRAELCERAGRIAAAAEACRNGIRSIGRMPPRLRVRKDATERRARLVANRNRLERTAR